ncbi:hypothetical protein [Actinorugispora endophytica]|uniref:PknH-like protein n=1 Tax=Actinorugispora endophytica TaxID=1605990 RepID=A0A4R6UZL7_9ACTN|nr:hypothetical protein [Actinorugispora endophytica]TDQ52924.1 hypothetical protein EV190_10541 [Actinorugispora endophytica]
MRTLRTTLPAASASLGAFALLFCLAGCVGAEEPEAASEAAPEEDSAPAPRSAGRLNEAQMVEFEDVTLLADKSEAGAYGELESVLQMDQLRESTELDKPQCLDAVNQWGRLPEVREAPASLATFGNGEETITHMLIELPEKAAEEAIDTVPPAECGTYQATAVDGTATTYTVRDLGIKTIGEESRAFVVETEVDGEQVLLYSLLYRNGGYLGTTSLLGGDDGEQRLVDFTTAALERENKVLG